MVSCEIITSAILSLLGAKKLTLIIHHARSVNPRESVPHKTTMIMRRFEASVGMMCWLLLIRLGCQVIVVFVRDGMILSHAITYLLIKNAALVSNRRALLLLE